MRPLDPGQIAAALATLPGWSHRQGALHRVYRFGSFQAAIAYMHAASAAIDRLGHHPEWTNAYDRVTVSLTTHDAGDLVTSLDVELARLLERQAEGNPMASM